MGSTSASRHATVSLALRTAPLAAALCAILCATLPATVWSAAPRDLHKKELRYPDGKMKERYSFYLDEHKREVRDGLDEEFYNTGVKKGEIPWQEGRENGPVVYYWPDGRKSYEANYKEGKKNGFATVWYANGQKQWQTVFRDGLTNGVWREWYQDGKRKFEANYDSGKLEGLATWWHETGRIWQERSFQSGVLVKGSVKEWDKTGRQTFPPPDTSVAGSDEPNEPVKHDSSSTDSQAKF